MNPEITRRLAKLHTQQLLREADAERLASEARSGKRHREVGVIAATLAALAAIARLGQHRTPPLVEPVPADETGAGLPVAEPPARSRSGLARRC